MSKKCKEGSVLSIVKDTLALVVITLVAAVLLGFVYEITKPIIAEREEQDKQNAYLAVFTEASSVVESKDVPELTDALANASEILTDKYNAAVTIDEACLAKDASGNTVGYIITVTDKKGYGGAIKTVFGYSLDGTVTGMEFLTLNETAGFGLEAEKDPEWRKQFYGVAVEEFTVTKSGAKVDSEIDALSGATVTSKAITEGINGGLVFAQYLAEQGIGGVQ
ncbi:MAG: FMN-binding protein [Lachnospiraceae bacterium]|nr:FMN-binding protein [Lachnospiraceae bacterium]